MNTSKKIIIVGGSGFIGTKLTEALIERNYLVTIIDLHPPKIQHNSLCFERINTINKNNGNNKNSSKNIYFDSKLFENCYGVINLAGATIGKRWNEPYQKLIYDSRIVTTKNIVTALHAVNNKPQVFIQASAVGYYGNQEDQLLTEDHPAGTDFLAKLCVDWEHEALKAEHPRGRIVIIRTAHVLGPGGLLTMLKPLFKNGLGGYFGSGNQYMPWIHWRDIVDIYIFALEHPVFGAYNVGAGVTISQKTLFKTFARTINVAIVWKIPYFAARLILGRFADALIASQNTDSSKLRRAGYVYIFNDLSKALESLKDMI